MKTFKFASKPKISSTLDQHFKPMFLACRDYVAAVMETSDYEKIEIGLRRSDDELSVFHTVVFHENHEDAIYNELYIEKMIKTLLWLKGGYQILFKGPECLGRYIEKSFSLGQSRHFDVTFMGKIYERPFKIICVSKDTKLMETEKSKDIGRHLEGCRIGFDAGGSDRKVSAVIDGRKVFSEEVIWHPKLNSDTSYHIEGIKDSLMRAASHLPRVDAIGVSSAGVYRDNHAMVASLFIKVPDDMYQKYIKNIYIDIAKDMGDIPIEVANDGDVTALAGSMSLNANEVLGIAMGTSEAAGFVNAKGFITGWLNELAFVPVDISHDAPLDEWSGDIGCGSSYFSQDAVIRLAPRAGIEIDSILSPAEKLKKVQELAESNHQGALEIFKTIGIYLGYTLAYYHMFYHIKYVLILGRVTSGIGGELILKEAKNVLRNEFNDLYESIHIQLPDEASRRVGQSIAAASLTKI